MESKENRERWLIVISNIEIMTLVLKLVHYLQGNTRQYWGNWQIT